MTLVHTGDGHQLADVEGTLSGSRVRGVGRQGKRHSEREAEEQRKCPCGPAPGPCPGAAAPLVASAVSAKAFVSPAASVPTAT